MSEDTKPSLDQLQATLHALAFIHQKLTTTRFYPEEFKSADQALKMIIEMAGRVSEDVVAATPKVETEPSKADANE